MGRLRANANNHGGIVLDAGVVERETDRALEGVATMFGGVPHVIHNVGRKGVDSPKLIIEDLHKDREVRLPDRQEIVIHGLSFDGRKGIPGLFEQEGDHIGRHA